MGPENGQLMFEKLQAEVDQYNIQWGSLGGKAILQPFQETTLKEKKKTRCRSPAYGPSYLHTSDVEGSQNGLIGRRNDIV